MAGGSAGRPHGSCLSHPMAHDVQQAVQVADHGLHRGLGVLHREAGEGPATVIEGEVSALGREQAQAEELEADSLGRRPSS